MFSAVSEPGKYIAQKKFIMGHAKEPDPPFWGNLEITQWEK